MNITFLTINGKLYVNLGRNVTASALVMCLESKHGGHHLHYGKDILYYNGAANESIYQDMIDTAFERTVL